MKSADRKNKQKTMSFDDLWDCLRPTSTPSRRLTFFCANRANPKHAQPALRKNIGQRGLILSDVKPKGESYKGSKKFRWNRRSAIRENKLATSSVATSNSSCKRSSSSFQALKVSSIVMKAFSFISLFLLFYVCVQKSGGLGE